MPQTSWRHCCRIPQIEYTQPTSTENFVSIDLALNRTSHVKDSKELLHHSFEVGVPPTGYGSSRDFRGSYHQQLHIKIFSS